ncbi:hypothetical protein FSP39_011612 [Pinctada imbricata]|uniref:HAT C-terminal dimerisation domain-containing protein n=1 Tax=Pinctada imbricata TaxID=66713 RepID=A0AA88XK05_PINIB|nr:hypothetical protein FSP39_011612 [Pinctada imbricata]
MLDENTDRGNRKRLLVYAQYFISGSLNTKLLENIEIITAKADAETITNLVLSELRCKGLDIKKLVGIGTDGASVMTGRKNGVVQRLREQVPYLVGIHCAAHRCALAASQAAKRIPLLRQYSDTVSNIFFYFSGSALRSNKLREIQLLLNLPTLKYAQVHSVRRLSLQQAVEVLYRTYPALVMALEHEANTNPTRCDPVAKGLYFEVSQFRFIAMTHMLMDILPFLGKLSKVFQSEDLDFSKVKPIVESTCEALQDFVEVEGLYVDKLTTFVIQEEDKVWYRRPEAESQRGVVQEAIDINVDGFKGFPVEMATEDSNESTCDVELKYYSQQRDVLGKIIPEYVGNIQNILEERFKESELLSKMQVLQPNHIVLAHNSGDIARYGNQNVYILAEHFEAQDINKEEASIEYKQYKRLVVGTFPSASFREICHHMDMTYSEVMPNMAKLLKCCIVLPVSSAQCERGFSTQNRIKSRLRTTLNNASINDLMRISEDGSHTDSFDFKMALKMWKEEKNRKIFA